MRQWVLLMVLVSLVRSAADATVKAPTNEVVIVTWATPSYLRAFGAIVEHNRRWAAANGVSFIVDTADYLGTLPPPRQATWGKVLALRRALEECADAAPFLECAEQGGERQRRPQSSAVLLLDVDCALMGSAETLRALLSAGGGDDECGGGVPHIVAARYPLTGPATAASSPAISNGGIWVNSGALLVRKSPWSLKFVEEWWRLSNEAHWYGGDQGALWLLLADALAANDTIASSTTTDANLWDKRRRGERPAYRACLKEGVPTHSRLLQRCLSPFLPFRSRDNGASTEHSGGDSSKTQQPSAVLILDPRDYGPSEPRPMHFWSAMDIALNRRFLAGGLFDSSFVRSTLAFRVHGGRDQRRGQEDLIVQTKNPREIACGAPCLSWAERSRTGSGAPDHHGADSKPRAVVLSVNEGAFLVQIPLHTTGAAAGADAENDLLTSAKLVAWSTCGDVRIGLVDPASCASTFLSVVHSEDRNVLIPVGFRNDIIVHGMRGQSQEIDDGSSSYGVPGKNWRVESPWSSRSETRKLVCELMRSRWHWGETGTLMSQICDDVDIESAIMGRRCTRGLAVSWCIAHNATMYYPNGDIDENNYAQQDPYEACQALVVLNITDASTKRSTLSGGLLVGQVKVSEEMKLCVDGSPCESSVALVENLYRLNYEWSLKYDHGTSDTISNAIVGAHRSALQTHARQHWSDFFKCTPASAAPSRYVLEDYTKYSESHLWKLMMSFYDRKGIESWSSGVVPHFITSSSFIGKSYAKVLKGYIRDLVAKKNKELDPEQPLYIIELGTGSGKFSYYMLRTLVQMKDTLDFPIDKICYVMTDFTESNFNYWAEHPQLKPFFETGQLESAIFDAVTDTTITLSHSGVVLSPGSVTNPICIVANYVFDTLSHDIFQVVPAPAGSGGSGILKEGLVSVGSKRAEEEDPLEPEIIRRLDNRFRYDETSENYYDNEEDDGIHFERILHWYRDYFRGADESGAAPPDRSGASILLPIGALRALRRLTRFTSGRCLVVSGDKGNINPEHFRGLMDPVIAVHGSFSVMVNYHAIGAYFTSRGGFALHNPQEEASLKVSTFVLTGDGDAAAERASAAAGEGGKAGARMSAWTGDQIEARNERRAKAFPHLVEAFHDTIVQFSPSDFNVMQKAMKEDAPTPSLKSVVALLKLSDHDPEVFYKFRDVILNQVPNYGSKLRNDLLRGIPRVWTNYFMLDQGKDVAFEIGRFYYITREYAKALEFYRISSESIGEHHVTAHNMGLCYYSMSKFPESLECFSKSLDLKKDYEKARSWRSKVEQELTGQETPVISWGHLPPGKSDSYDF